MEDGSRQNLEGEMGWYLVNAAAILYADNSLCPRAAQRLLFGIILPTEKGRGIDGGDEAG